MKRISVPNTCQNIANLYIRGIILSNPGIEIYPETGTCKKHCLVYFVVFLIKDI